jgi:two-component system chemotaxis response regulator CheY
MDILVVDDSKVMRSMVQRAIRQAGYKGLTFGEAANGKEALAKMKEERPRVVLSDWNMPEMTGIEFLTIVRAEKNTVPFGFITSESSTAIRELAMESGANFILAKPFTSDQVQSALTPILGSC